MLACLTDPPPAPASEEDRLGELLGDRARLIEQLRDIDAIRAELVELLREVEQRIRAERGQQNAPPSG